MDKKCRIVMMGGGSVNWSPKLINDFMLTKGLEEAGLEGNLEKALFVLYNVPCAVI